MKNVPLAIAVIIGFASIVATESDSAGSIKGGPVQFIDLAQQCAPDVHHDTMRRIVKTESSFNPFAIGVVGGHLEKQPRNRQEAISTAQWLESRGFNYSVGLAQVNKTNFRKYGLTLETAFEVCPNLHAGGSILKECFIRARKTTNDDQEALRNAFSCYYSGNFITGYKHGYVKKILGDFAIVHKVAHKATSIKVKSVAKSKTPASAVTIEASDTSQSSQSALLF